MQSWRCQSAPSRVCRQASRSCTSPLPRRAPPSGASSPARSVQRLGQSLCSCRTEWSVPCLVWQVLLLLAFRLAVVVDEREITFFEVLDKARISSLQRLCGCGRAFSAPPRPPLACRGSGTCLPEALPEVVDELLLHCVVGVLHRSKESGHLNAPSEVVATASPGQQEGTSKCARCCPKRTSSSAALRSTGCPSYSSFTPCGSYGGGNVTPWCSRVSQIFLAWRELRLLVWRK